MTHSQVVHVELPQVRLLNYLFFSAGTIIYFQLPVLSSIYIENYGFTPSQSGILMSADMTGILIAPLTAPFWIHRVPWRPVMVFGIFLAALPNVICYYLDTFLPLLTMRYLAGLGQGTLLTFIFPCIAAFKNPDREFAIAAAFMIFIGAALLFASPELIKHAGRDGLFIAIAIFTLVPLLLIKYAPLHNPKTSGEEPEAKKETSSRADKINIGLGLLTVCLFFYAMDCVWPFVERLGDTAGIPKRVMANGLSASLVFSILGASICAFIAGVINRNYAIYAGVALTLASFTILAAKLSAISFVFALCLYNFATTLVIPLLNGWVASMDQTGRVVVLLPVMQSLGGVLGPVTAGLVIVNEMYVSVIYTGTSILLLCLLVFYLAQQIRKKYQDNISKHSDAREVV